jgi:hypothetical protein
VGTVALEDPEGTGLWVLVHSSLCLLSGKGYLTPLGQTKPFGAPLHSLLLRLLVRVAASRAWTDENIKLAKGDKVSISASGFVTVTTDGHIPPMSPAA